MPVRIYEIAKKLGIESKEVLAKAKQLGIAGARVPSSSLDKITGEYLEQQLALLVPPPPPPPPPEEPKLVVAPIPEATPPLAAEVPAEVAPKVEVAVPVPVTAEIITPVEQPPTAPEPVVEVKQHEPPPAPAPAATPVALAPAPVPVPTVESPPPLPPAPPELPPTPPKPRVGDKVGFIQLPPRPQVGEKVGFIKLPPKPAPRPEPQRGRPGSPGAFGRPGSPQGRPGFQRPGMRGTTGPGQAQRTPIAPAEPRFVPPSTGEVITLKPPIIVRDLAEQLKKKPFQLIADLMQLNVFANVNQAIDETTAQKLCAKYGFRFEVEKRERGGGIVHAPVKKIEVDLDDKPEDLKLRAPVVTIMGHVDHGKTTLLDVVRKSDVAGGEAGGITQHIGAYTISVPHPEKKGELTQITFLDTPGHAAFSSMRARGANVTDIVVLVVAANDGVMPQTLEALSHAQAAKVPIIVAVNKMDHPAANPLRVRQQLAEKGLTPDEWGGGTLYVDCSALAKQGIDKLLEMIVFQADLLELKANPTRPAKGNVIESGLEPGGPTATVLVRKGTLRVGDVVIAGQHFGRVRALISEEGHRLKEAGPSVAVKILGMNGVPEAGLEFTVVENEKEARIIGEERSLAAKELEKEKRPKVTLESFFAAMQTDAAKVLKIVVKADTQGSVEAIVDALKKVESPKVLLEVIHSAVGTITESDVLLSSASKAIILGFHTRIDNGVSDIAKREGVQIKLYAIIYELIDQVKEAMAGLLDPLTREVVVGAAEVRKIFTLSKGGNVAGCIVANGRIVKGKVRVMRRKGLIYEGVTLSLRRFQDEVNEVRAGMECGIRIDGFNDFQIGDSIECYSIEKVPQKL